MNKKIFIEAGECTGCEWCCDRLPKVFRMGDDGVSHILDPAGAPEGDIQEVVDNCPAECIYWK